MMYYTDDFPGRVIKNKGKEYLYFGGTAYLGLQKDQTFLSIYTKNVQKYGTTYSASRKANIQLNIFNETEDYLKQLIGCEDCLTLSSGFLASQLVSQYFYNGNYTCLYAPNTHVALHYGKSLNEIDHETLSNKIFHSIKKNENVVLFLDSLDFYGNNYPHFNWLKQLPLNKLTVVADDSHGLGVIGKDGEGIFSFLSSFIFKELIICGSLGKGYAIQAGLVCGTKETINNLKGISTFNASSPASPASLATLREASSLYKEKRELLLKNIELFKNELKNNLSDFSFMINYPAFSFNNPQLASYLENNNILVTNFKYPDENSGSIQRIVISSHHTKEDILVLAEKINSFYT
ncbi:aminotransferase class I/II-fold pyridoxal phosphate-dependent enzyme [Abyssalbus ytuae]|uniref:Aminotransferase class I/II-fold pyridoxal phosphate-dependent enzyme n=1 Tax=Abyssalbus ytuae TaxID=2926907 RepID=A0A9E7CUA7_9FLAO|nr:aminotransferase class I/II-fold pyridoxal phosphate-dependent enzyme [Abyssalbus ytuae]UOB18057.1 aminotransferase class I/II-fold pyridoxal phosphate-dependent enzyme [Abyssalbus ytuae]